VGTPTAEAAVAAVAALIARARTAQRSFDPWSQARVDEAVTAAAWAIVEPARNRALAEHAVRATGLGDVATRSRRTTARRSACCAISRVPNRSVSSARTRSAA